MLGQPVSLTLPQVVGCKLVGSINPLTTSIDIVLGITKVTLLCSPSCGENVDGNLTIGGGLSQWCSLESSERNLKLYHLYMWYKNLHFALSLLHKVIDGSVCRKNTLPLCVSLMGLVDFPALAASWDRWKVCRVFWTWCLPAVSSRPNHHRQHVPRVQRYCQLLPCRPSHTQAL